MFMFRLYFEHLPCKWLQSVQRWVEFKHVLENCLLNDKSHKAVKNFLEVSHWPTRWRQSFLILWQSPLCWDYRHLLGLRYTRKNSYRWMVKNGVEQKRNREGKRQEWVKYKRKKKATPCCTVRSFWWCVYGPQGRPSHPWHSIVPLWHRDRVPRQGSPMSNRYLRGDWESVTPAGHTHIQRKSADRERDSEFY